MRVSEACSREVIVADRQDSIAEAARLMRRHHVGTVVVTDKSGGDKQPVGILTDRDIAIELIALGTDIDSVNVGDVMSDDLTNLRPDDGIMEALQFMKEKAVRRAPVIDESGELIGILAVDDIIELIAEQLLDVSNLLNRAYRKEERIRR